ncbi:hypothetical protein ACFE04_022263 [Oxalis oulophora]
MASKTLVFSLSLTLLVLATMQVTQAVDYTYTNTAGSSAGGTQFTNEIGEDYARQTMSSATDFIWRVFQQTDSPSDRKDVQQVSLFIDDTDGVAYTVSNQIHVNANYIGNLTGDVKAEFNGVMYHEMTHVWQWNGDGQANGGLIEGIADFVRLRANYIPSHWVQPGGGDKWDQGYDVTARFLDYCNGLSNGFVAELNKKMRSGYDDSYFLDLLGKSVDQLWTDYKAMYGN